MEAMASLLPLLPLSSACSMHWFLRLLASLVPPHESHMFSQSQLCLRLLVAVTRQLAAKDSRPAQLLQTQ